MTEDKPSNGNVDRYRIDQLERLAERLTERFEQSQERYSQELRALRSAIEELHRSTLIHQTKACPAPGLCLELKTTMNIHSENIEEIKVWQQNVEKKAAWVLGAIAVATPIVSMILPYVLKYFFSLP